MAGTFLHSFMICLQRLDQSGSPVAADEEEKSNVTPCLMSPPRPAVGDRSPSHAGTALWPGAGAESPHHCYKEYTSCNQAQYQTRQALPSK